MCDALSDEIKNYYQKNQQTESILKSKFEIAGKIRSQVFTEEYHSQLQTVSLYLREVFVFGSAITPVAANDGDLDLVINVSVFQPNAKQRSVFVLDILFQMIKKGSLGTVNKLKFIQNALVPIIKMRVDNIDVDISVLIDFNPPTSILNAMLINTYALIDDRFAPLCFVIRCYFKTLIDNYKTGKDRKFEMNAMRCLPSSHATTLLVNHFLQTKGIIPNLIRTNPYRFSLAMFSWNTLNPIYGTVSKPLPDNVIDMLKQCKPAGTENLSMSNLFKEFFKYYAPISFKDNYLNSINSSIVNKMGSFDTGMVIIDPYSILNPARRVLWVFEFTKIMLITKKLLDDGNDLKSLMKLTIDFEKLRKKNKSVEDCYSIVESDDDEQENSELGWFDMQTGKIYRKPRTETDESQPGCSQDSVSSDDEPNIELPGQCEPEVSRRRGRRRRRPTQNQNESPFEIEGEEKALVSTKNYAEKAQQKPLTTKMISEYSQRENNSMQQIDWNYFAIVANTN